MPKLDGCTVYFQFAAPSRCYSARLAATFMNFRGRNALQDDWERP